MTKGKLTPPPEKSLNSKAFFKKTIITTAVATAVALSAGLTAAAELSPQATLNQPVKAGNWSAAVNQNEYGNYDINVFDQLITGTGEKTLQVENTFTQADFEAVKALKGFGEFGNYYEDDEHNPYEVGMVDGVFINGADTNVTFKDASVVVTGSALTDKPYVEIGGVYHRDGVAEYTGATTTLSVTSASEVDANGEAWVYGYTVENPLGYAETQRKVTFSADKTNISASSTNENGLIAIAFGVSADAVDKPSVTFARGETTLSASTANAEKLAAALWIHNSDGNDGNDGSVTLAEGASLHLSAEGGNARGLHIDHGIFTSNGTLDIRAESKAPEGFAYGIIASNDARLTFNGKTDVYAQGDEAYALYVGVDEWSAERNDGTLRPTITFGKDSVTTLNGAVYVEAGHSVTADGKMTINGDVDIAGSVVGAGDLTINGQKEEYGDAMEGGFVRENAELHAQSITFENVDFKNYGEIEVADKVTINDGAVVTNYQGFHDPAMTINQGGRFIETYDLDDPEDLAEFNSGIFAIDGDLLEFAGGTLEAMTMDGEFMKVTGIKILPDPGGEHDDTIIRYKDGKYEYETFEVAASPIEAGPRLQIHGGTIDIGTLTLTEGDAEMTGGTTTIGSVVVEGAFDLTKTEKAAVSIESMTLEDGSALTLNADNLQVGAYNQGAGALNLTGTLTVKGGFASNGLIAGDGDLTIDAAGGKVDFTENKSTQNAEGLDVAINNLTISNATMTNTATMEIADSITLTNVKIDNLENGDVEAKNAIYLGEGTVLRNYGHFDADNWVLLEGSKYLEAYDEGDPELTNGNMVHDSGRVEFAGGLYGLVSDENALKSWTLTTDRDEAAEWGDDYTQPQLVISASEYNWDYVTVDSTATESNALEVTGGKLALSTLPKAVKYA